MKRYFGKFASSGDVQTAVDSGALSKPYVAYVQDGDYIDYNSKYADYSSMYLTLDIISAGTLSWSISDKKIQYSKNEGEWSNVNQGGNWSIDVVAGDTVRLKGTNESYYKQYGTYSRFSSSTSKFRAYGNVMSLIYGDNFATATTVGNNAFINLFKNCYSLVDAKNMVFPAMTLGSGCYIGFFEGCVNLIDGPAILPATTLAYDCYDGFYYDCSSLTGNTILPATTLAGSCYNSMYYHCYNLEKAPDLLADTIQSGSYSMMFYGCKKLSYVKCLASAVGGNTTSWLYQAPATGTFVKAAGATWTTGVNGIPNGWTVIEE